MKKRSMSLSLFKKTWKLILLGIIAYIVYIGYQFYDLGHSKAGKEIKQFSYNSKDMNKEYLSILGDLGRANLTFDMTADTKIGQSANIFMYDSLYKIVIFAFQLKDCNDKLSSILDKLERKSNPTEYEVYVAPILKTFGEENSFSYIVDKYPPASFLHLSIWGDSTRLINKNDSIVNYFSYAKNFSVSLNNTDKKYIFGECKGLSSDAEKPCPISILFLKRGEKIYFLEISGIPPANKVFPKNALFDIITQK